MSTCRWIGTAAFILAACAPKDGTDGTGNAPGFSGQGPASGAPSPQQIASATIPSVVVLTMSDAQGQTVGLGTGFAIAPGVLATNYHVIAGAVQGVAKGIEGQGQTRIDGVLAIDPEHDLALLGAATLAPPLHLERSNGVQIGEAVFAVGNPEGLEHTFSSGIVSAIRAFGPDSLIQVTAPISPGSSGGPVLDARGDVIGVATATFRGGQNLNFAVPVSYLRSLLARRAEPTPLRGVAKAETAFTRHFGRRSTDAVSGENFDWDGMFDFQSGYTFSLRNESEDTITDVYCLVIFYDKSGRPLETDLVRYAGLIPPGLAQRVASTVNPSVKRLTTRTLRSHVYASAPNSRLEFRILDFRVAE